MAVTGKQFYLLCIFFGSIPDIAVNDYKKNKSGNLFLVNTQGSSRLAF